jgi:sulfatase modifying factor 1
LKCVTCSSDNPDRAKFCVECGTAVVARCNACHAELPAGAKLTRVSPLPCPSVCRATTVGALVFGVIALLGVGAAVVHASDVAIVRDCPDCPDLIVVPPGAFKMGLQPETARDQARAAPLPQHEVKIRAAFLIGLTEVTRDEFAAFAKATGYRPERGCTTYDRAERTFAESRAHNWQDPGFAQTGRDPVVCVDWRDANAYVNWLSKESGKRYRLPSEAEWEYAARAGTQSSLYWGSPGDACTFGNVADGSNLRIRDSQIPNRDFFACTDGFAFTAPVAAFKPNAFGLYDVIGNVWEWTQDCFNPSYDGAPTNGAAWLSGDCGRRIARGGSWTSPARHVTVTFRDPDPATYRSSYLGFRVVRDE